MRFLKTIGISLFLCFSIPCINAQVGDFDGDGILNVNDLDDDNDGILDTDEGCFTQSSSFSINRSASTLTLNNGSNGFVLDVTSLDNSFNISINGTSLTSTEIEFHRPIRTTEFADGTSYGGGGVNNVWSIAWNNPTNINTPLIRLIVNSNGSVELFGAKTRNGPLEPMVFVNGLTINPVSWNTGANTIIINQVINGNTVMTGRISSLVQECPINSDMDSFTDQTDLDSDNDGCFDTVEAGFLDGDNDGILGVSPVTVDAFGRVTGQGGYINPLDANGSLIRDFQEAGVPPTINSEPNDQYVTEGTNAVFEVSSAGTDLNYQWQVSSDNGLTYVDILGENNASLTISNASTGEDGNQYRLKLANVSFRCSEVFSNFGTLIISSDSDGDGVVDIFDLDDDNDGVPDLEESENLIQAATFDDVVQPNNGNNLGVAIAPWLLTAGTTNIVKVNGSTSYGNAGPRLDANPYTLPGTDQHYFDISGVGDLYQSFTLTASRTITYSGFFSPRDGTFGSGEIMIRQGVGNTGTILDTSGIVNIPNNGGNSQNAPWTYVERTVVLPAGTYSMVVNMSNPTNFDEGKVQAIDLDSDGDGIPNTQDLDSDNDGIYDAVEAGHGQAHSNGVVIGNVGADGIPDSVQSAPNNGLINYTISDSDTDGLYDLYELDADNDTCNDVSEAGYTDANNDGVLGTTPTLVDGNGLVIGTSVTDGYTLPNNADGNLVFDFQEAGIAPSITSEPSDITTFVSTSASFLATYVNSTTYQWQISTDSGTTFTDLPNGALYSGTDTPSLTIRAVTMGMNDYRFRLIGSNISYLCSPPIISRTAVLNIRASTVITNRRITYRVNKS